MPGTLRPWTFAMPSAGALFRFYASRQVGHDEWMVAVEKRRVAPAGVRADELERAWDSLRSPAIRSRSARARHPDLM